MMLLAISGWQLPDSLTKKSGFILTFKGLGSNSLHYYASSKLPKASYLLNKSI